MKKGDSIFSPLDFRRRNMKSIPQEYQKLYEYLTNLEKSFWINTDGQTIQILDEKESQNAGFLIPALTAKSIGSRSFKRDYNLDYAYASGAMAGTIASEELVISMAKNGFLAFFGSGGVLPARIEAAIEKIQKELGDKTYGFNLLNNPFEPAIEESTVELYLKHNIHRVSASAYIIPTPYLVHYRVKGIKKRDDGTIEIPNKVLAKLSRREVAEKFLSPPPESILKDLVKGGKITQQEADLAREIPVADDIIAEADSGGHTDKRPFISLIPQILSLRSEFADRYPGRSIRIGAAGGISTPQSITGAFAMGADFVLTGSINQSCRESGTSDMVKELLAKAEVPDVRMAPAADMFESGAQVQVLKYGTMYAMRGEKLYQLYKSHKSIEEIPEKDRTFLEKSVFHTTLDDIWNQTAEFFKARNPKILEAALKDPHRKMALIFRWYLGKSSRWAFAGDESRKSDFQIWCGPSMGSFNQWAKGTKFENRENRSAPEVAKMLMKGAAYLTRLSMVRSNGIEVPPALWEYSSK